jgi:predicted ATP-binding protein involved in virulence
MQFKILEINHWQQFESIKFDLHDRLTIITGANGSGKTTLLNIFAKHYGWQSVSLATPKRESEGGIVKFFSRYFNGKDRSSDKVIGKIHYSNNVQAKLTISESGSAQYNLEIQNKQPVKCFYIPSHRPIFRYQTIANIPAAKKSKQNAFNEVSSVNMQRYFGGQNQSASFAMKNAIISWIINGYGVKSGDKYIMQHDDEQIQHFEGFQLTLKKILPKTLGFEALEIRNMEVVFVCNGGADEFLLETASGGISALIDIAWQIYMYSTTENTDFTVIIDEIENHLHPTMQRNILQDLINAFPEARFIVTTHSPLVVGSVKDSTIYALKYDENRKVVSHYLDMVNRAKTAAEILDEVLGVSFTMPIWVEDKLNEIVKKYSRGNLTGDDFASLREELAQAGLERLMTHAIKDVIGGQHG